LTNTKPLRLMALQHVATSEAWKISIGLLIHLSTAKPGSGGTALLLPTLI
jgi:hypothetical protein